MTDNTEAENEDFVKPEESIPDLTSYRIRAVRAFEMDFTQRQIEAMMERTDAETPEEAIENVFLEREVELVEPEQKLLGADVSAEE